MATKQDVSCPVCDADVPLAGDEKKGDEVYCSYCRAALTVKSVDEEEIELEDDL